ncbi:MAG: cytochrome c family protein [Deltaproteobacteria bacterium]|nr:cytochrome c family protein [Deltaproteobacteria bacterium]
MGKKKIWLRACFAGMGAAAVLLLAGGDVYAGADKGRVYVGSEACRDCHEDEFNNFETYAKKASSFKSVQAMKKGLTESEIRECLKCHSTGYGEPGGFVSEKETPHLKDAGCEVCHGPGSIHCETEDAEDIKGHLSVADCEKCHSSDRVDAFKFKPLIYGGAH